MSYKIKYSALNFFLIVIPFSIIVGLRGNTPDTSTYYNIFKNIELYNLKSYKEFYLETGVELGWGIYSKIVSIFTESPIILFGLFSFFTFWIIYKSSEILNLKFNNVLVFYLPSAYFLMQQFMQIRQGFAVPVVILASLLYLKGNKIAGIIFFILAIFFHQVVIPYIIVFMIYLIVNKYFPIASSFRFKILNVLILIIGFIIVRSIIYPIAFVAFERLQAYSESDYSEKVGFFSLSNIKFYIEFFIILFFSNKKLYDNKFYIFLAFIFTIGLTLRVAFFDFAILSGRLSNVFLMSEIFLMPMLILSRFKLIYAYMLFYIYFFLILYVTWFFQASPYLEKSYFIPLS
ncbi:EpsG family protein [Acinetobacter indicus]|uniref:EpsG family protein n=1 Tax=Acinetobacter indicus TaxID=756892 RepID=UPI000CECC6EF|nr:EpsG family protein [Acinetobacter indicus]